MRSADVCVVGSANVDIVASAPRHPKPGETLLGHDYHEYPGGKGLNQAVAAARSGATVTFVGALGDDDAGAGLRSVLDADGIDPSQVETVDEPTGRAVIIVSDGGENSIVVVPGANATVSIGDSLPDAAVVLCQLEVPLDAVERALEIARGRGSTTVLNPAPAQRLSNHLVALVDVITPNQHEVELLGGADALLAAGCGAVVVTRGAAGVDVYTGDGVAHIAAIPVEVVDTTGAGDAFNGALASRLAAGGELYDAARWAVAAGALATTVAGAVPAQPHATQIEALLA